MLGNTVWHVLMKTKTCKCKNDLTKKMVGQNPRTVPKEGLIIECPLDGLFHDVVTVIITSRMAVWELEDDDDDNE